MGALGRRLAWIWESWSGSLGARAANVRLVSVELAGRGPNTRSMVAIDLEDHAQASPCFGCVQHATPLMHISGHARGARTRPMALPCAHCRETLFAPSPVSRGNAVLARIKPLPLLGGKPGQSPISDPRNPDRRNGASSLPIYFSQASQQHTTPPHPPCPRNTRGAVAARSRRRSASGSRTTPKLHPSAAEPASKSATSRPLTTRRRLRHRRKMTPLRVSLAQRPCLSTACSTMTNRSTSSVQTKCSS